MPEDYGNIEAELKKAIEQVVTELPQGSARIETWPSKGGGIVVNIFPANRQAALMGAHAENGLALVDFWFGEFGTTWELPIEGQNPGATKEELLAEVQQLCRAVLDG